MRSVRVLVGGYLEWRCDCGYIRGEVVFMKSDNYSKVTRGSLTAKAKIEFF